MKRSQLLAILLPIIIFLIGIAIVLVLFFTRYPPKNDPKGSNVNGVGDKPKDRAPAPVPVKEFSQFTPPVTTTKAPSQKRSILSFDPVKQSESPTNSMKMEPMEPMKPTAPVKPFVQSSQTVGGLPQVSDVSVKKMYDMSGLSMVPASSKKNTTISVSSEQSPITIMTNNSTNEDGKKKSTQHSDKLLNSVIGINSY